MNKCLVVRVLIIFDLIIELSLKFQSFKTLVRIMESNMSSLLPSHHTENGVVERKNIVLIEMARLILNIKNLAN